MNALPQVPPPTAAADDIGTLRPTPRSTPLPTSPPTQQGSPPVAPPLESRATSFLLPIGREQVPVWVFPPASLQHAHAGLVLRAGPRELLVFTRPALDWGCGGLRLHVLDAMEPMGMDEPPSHAPDAIAVRRLWRRTVSHSGDLQGLALKDPDSLTAWQLRQHQPDPAARRWVRCMIEIDPGAR